LRDLENDTIPKQPGRAAPAKLYGLISLEDCEVDGSEIGQAGRGRKQALKWQGPT
jgi:hypothetical protein